tara:strand:+ start:385 stop:1323 length:939 start_codon:yes stop_codon:yes gene_type:complete
LTLTYPKKITIASRESKLALWQAENVKNKLSQLYPNISINILGMKTKGDQILDRNFSIERGKDLFIKELELAMIDGKADIAVHSLKDLPTDLPRDFKISAVLEREDPRDVFISNKYKSLLNLPKQATIGTNSLRRKAFILRMFPLIKVIPLRGNLETRISKLDQGLYDGIILAAAGLKRLNLTDRISSFIGISDCLPAPGQGTIAIEILSQRKDLDLLLKPINHIETNTEIRAERSLSKELFGNCQLPLAAFATLSDNIIRMRGMVASVDGKKIAYADMNGKAENPEILGKTVARELNIQGAQSIILESLKL